MNLETQRIENYTNFDVIMVLALSHADKTLENHFREDYSSFHVFDYNSNSGSADGHQFLLKHSTGQKPANSKIDVPLSYADYYFVKALIRYLEK